MYSDEEIDNYIEEVSQYIKDISKDEKAILKDAEIEEVLALETIKYHLFFRACTSDRFGFWLAQEAYIKWKQSKE